VEWRIRSDGKLALILRIKRLSESGGKHGVGGCGEEGKDPDLLESRKVSYEGAGEG